MRKKQAVHQCFRAGLVMTALLLTRAVTDADTSVVASETVITDTQDPDFLILDPEGE